MKAIQLSIEERLRDVSAMLTLITTATMVEDDNAPMPPDDVLAAIHEAANRGFWLLQPIRQQAPGEILNWTPKDGAR